MPKRAPREGQDQFEWDERAQSSQFWMRSVQFAGLHRVLHRVAISPDGIRVKNLNELVISHHDYRTERGSGIPSKTTLYHARNTLLQLGVLRREESRLVVADDDPLVSILLTIEPSHDESLPVAARECFAALVLRNQDCYADFFSLFLIGRNASPRQFRQDAFPVAWTATSRGVLLRSVVEQHQLLLDSSVEVRSILYGVRDWAEKQLLLTGEFYDSRRGNVIYPLKWPDADDLSSTLSRFFRYLRMEDDSEWITISIRDLLVEFCEIQGYATDAVFRSLRHFSRDHAGFIKLVSTIEDFSTMGASSRKQADFQLKSAFRDSRGRVISHIRLHKSLQEI